MLILLYNKIYLYESYIINLLLLGFGDLSASRKKKGKKNKRVTIIKVDVEELVDSGEDTYEVEDIEIEDYESIGSIKTHFSINIFCCCLLHIYT